MLGFATRDEILGLTAEVRALGKQLVPAPEKPTKIISVKVWFDRGGKRVYEGMYTGKLTVQPYASMSGKGFLILDEHGVQMADHKGEVFYEVTEQKAEPEVKSVGLYGIGAFQELRKYADELNHRIELLELRLNKQKAQPTKGAKR